MHSEHPGSRCCPEPPSVPALPLTKVSPGNGVICPPRSLPGADGPL